MKNDKHLGFWLPADQHHAFEDACYKNGFKMSQVMRKFVTEYISVKGRLNPAEEELREKLQALLGGQ